MTACTTACEFALPLLAMMLILVITSVPVYIIGYLRGIRCRNLAEAEQLKRRADASGRD